MRTLRITQLKANPAGKTKQWKTTPAPEQLAAEWLDIRNSGEEPVNIQGLFLTSKVFGPHRKEAALRRVVILPDFDLPPCETLRIHSGSGPGMAALDRKGAQWHLFTGLDGFVWDLEAGDAPGLFEPAENCWVDRSSYSEAPPEDVVMMRVGDHMQPPYREVYRR